MECKKKDEDSQAFAVCEDNNTLEHANVDVIADAKIIRIVFTL